MDAKTAIPHPDGKGLYTPTINWTHLSGRPKCKCWSHPVLSASQRSAELTQDFGTLTHALNDYGPDVIAQAVRVLEAGAVYRSEKALGVAQWAADLHRKLDGLKGERRRNLLWLAVATAPAGFCHLRSTVVSTLLDDIKAGLDFDTISQRWAKKLNPLQYQRPQAAPTNGAIRQAEVLFGAMGAALALERRFATLADVKQFLWRPTEDPSIPNPQPKGSTGLFDHLRKDKQPVKELELPAVAITFEKFRQVVLPTATEMEVLTPTTGSYYGLVTAVNADAAALLQWDGLDGCERNPVNHYFWHGGSSADQWHLKRGGWSKVTGLFLSPHQWQQPEKFSHQGTNAHFALEGAWDERGESAGLALFPELLRSELHPVRSVIEAHSRSRQLVGAALGTANGIAFQKGSTYHLTVRVKGIGGWSSYRLDRWD